ncbi:hypothetical protein CICLE_v10003070mg [Citrus x clementina]|uniref:Uncharacterized protein n=2 Tax=Citrus TaxID=2706 RepID=V4SIK8_CITCL|nr:hypothetical protein CICLE_v10003070mg [Citrus x clementina]GAY52057.1 hypothetical protein CUMW_139020 [Citrus unshiu]
MIVSSVSVHRFRLTQSKVHLFNEKLITFLRNAKRRTACQRRKRVLSPGKNSPLRRKQLLFRSKFPTE